MPSPIKKGFRHADEAGNLFARKVAVIQQSIICLFRFFAFLVKHLDGLTACCHHWGMSKKSKKPKKANDLTGYESAQRKRFIRSEQESDNQETSSVLL